MINVCSMSCFCLMSFSERFKTARAESPPPDRAVRKGCHICRYRGYEVCRTDT